MITEYHRPHNLDEALALLSREGLHTLPLAGGTALDRTSPQRARDFAVVDLQALGLDGLERRGNTLELGCMLTLQGLLEYAAGDSSGMPTALVKAILHEAAYNLRQMATIGGTVASAGGRSPLLTALLAMDASLALLPGDQFLSLGDFLPLRPGILRDRLILKVLLPANLRPAKRAGLCLAYEYVARTPADQPIVCAAVALWPSGRTRVALGGYGVIPALAFDGQQSDGADLAAQDAYSQAEDEEKYTPSWASAEYRREMAGVLTRRCLEYLTSGAEG